MHGEDDKNQKIKTQKLDQSILYGMKIIISK